MTNLRLVLLATTALTAMQFASTPSQAQTSSIIVAQAQTDEKKSDKLSIGDAAPALEATKWLQGKEVKKFEKDKVYVVEFWATWCPPCRTSIPHLTELQKKNKDVTFIGVSAFENDQKQVEPFAVARAKSPAIR